MDKAYYRAYYNYERNHWWFKARSEILKKYIRRNIAAEKNLSILNVGVATGASTTMLQNFGTVTSLEYEQECIDFVKNKVNFEIIQGSILELPFADQQFDLVCAFDVIEHVEDDSKAVQELARVCVPGGRVLITVPAFMDLWSEHDEVNHHFRRYNKSSLIALFNNIKSGHIEYCSFFNSILFPAIFLARKLFIQKRPHKVSPQSDFARFSPGILNGLLYGILRAENFVISTKKKFPFGVSLILEWSKKSP